MIDIPARMKSLPRDRLGRPVPWFVAWIDGQPEFRAIRRQGVALAYNKGTCWLCGQPLGRYRAFVIGPMCVVNRVSAEPPSHRDCAIYATKACPFLSNPSARRRTSRMPDAKQEPAGIAIERNPGVVAVWMTKSYEPFYVDQADAGRGFLFNIGEPKEILWFTSGRPAERQEIVESLVSGLPILEQQAIKDGPEGVRHLVHQFNAAMSLLG